MFTLPKKNRCHTGTIAIKIYIDSNFFIWVDETISPFDVSNCLEHNDRLSQELHFWKKKFNQYSSIENTIKNGSSLKDITFCDCPITKDFFINKKIDNIIVTKPIYINNFIL